MKNITIPWQYDSRFSIFAYTYNTMIHLNNRKFYLCLLLMEYTTDMIRAQVMREDDKE